MHHWSHTGKWIFLFDHYWGFAMNTIGYYNYLHFIWFIVLYLIEFPILIFLNFYETFVMGIYLNDGEPQSSLRILLCTMIMLHNFWMLLYAYGLYKMHSSNYQINSSSVESIKLQRLYCQARHLFKGVRTKK